MCDNKIPIANFSFSPECFEADQTIQFDASNSYDPDGNIDNYLWDFNDGQTYLEFDEFIDHSFSAEDVYLISLVVQDDEGATGTLSKRLEIHLSEPPITTHTFSGNDPSNIQIKLDALDNCSGVDRTYYSINWDTPKKITVPYTFYIDLHQVKTITYHSVDKAGNVEKLHIINIYYTTSEKINKYMYFKDKYDSCPKYPESYKIFLKTGFFVISDNTRTIVFIDNITVKTWDSFLGSSSPNALGIKLEGYPPQQLGVSQVWSNIGAVDWTGKQNKYNIDIQLATLYWESSFCFRALTKTKTLVLFFPSPYGLISVFKDTYYPDLILHENIPAAIPSNQKISNIIYPFESQTYAFEITNEMIKASISVSWPGSDLDLILYDPYGREINPEVASIDPAIKFEEGDTYEQYNIINPNPGIWEMRINAIDVLDTGEKYTAIIDLIEDQDGNGIPDDTDNCPNSKLGQTVIIDGCDSGAHNTLLSNGCSISDLVFECAKDATNHGGFISCVSHLTNSIKKDGIISGKEKGAIQSCAARSNLP